MSVILHYYASTASDNPDEDVCVDPELPFKFAFNFPGTLVFSLKLTFDSCSVNCRTRRLVCSRKRLRKAGAPPELGSEIIVFTFSPPRSGCLGPRDLEDDVTPYREGVL